MNLCEQGGCAYRNPLKSWEVKSTGLAKLGGQSEMLKWKNQASLGARTGA
jgi:hypothetical protein